MEGGIDRIEMMVFGINSTQHLFALIEPPRRGWPKHLAIFMHVHRQPTSTDIAGSWCGIACSSGNDGDFCFSLE